MKKIFLATLLLLLVLVLSACVNPLVKKDLSIDNDKLVAYFINDSRCHTENCDANFTKNVKNSLKQLFPSLEFIDYNYDSKIGKQFYKEYNLSELPALLFTAKIKDEKNYSRIENYLSAKNNLFSLKLGATFNPITGLHSIEFCNNKLDDNGDGKTDCEDSACASSLTCRDESPKKLDLFVMSYCPYGTKALDAMKEVLDNFDNQIDFNVHYIANKTDNGFKSLHGQKEVDEDIRELCAIKYYPKDYKYMDYIWCRDADLNADWKKCAQNFSQIETCFNSNEGEKLLTENIKLANELKIGASPTWVANNRYKFSGITANAVKENICKYNPSLGNDFCGVNLSDKSDVPAGSCN